MLYLETKGHEIIDADQKDGGELMKAVKIESDGSIKLPKEVLRFFPDTSELAVWTEGDTIILKRLSPLKPSEIAERAPEDHWSLPI